MVILTWTLDVNLETIIESIKEIGSENIQIEWEENYHNFYKEKQKKYTKEEIYKYFNYIKDQPNFDRYDHGIVGGINGYSKLVEALIDAVKDSNISFLNFIENGIVVKVNEKNQAITYIVPTRYTFLITSYCLIFANFSYYL